MNAASVIQFSGLAAAKAIGGEPLTYVRDSGAITITGIVNRNLITNKDFVRIDAELLLGVNMLTITAIYISKKDLLVSPSAGQRFLDQIGYIHRARYVKHTHVAWIVFCTQSQASTQADSTTITADNTDTTADTE